MKQTTSATKSRNSKITVARLIKTRLHSQTEPSKLIPKVVMTLAQNMNAVVFKEPGVIVVEERPRPRIQKSTDAIVKVRMAALCGR